MTLPLPIDKPTLPTGQLTTSWRQFFLQLAGLFPIDGTFNATPRSTTGAITTASCGFAYRLTGDTVLLSGTLNVSNNGTGATALLIDLPASFYASGYCSGCAFLRTGSGLGTKVMQASISLRIFTPPATVQFTAVCIANADGTYPTLGATDWVEFTIVYKVPA